MRTYAVFLYYFLDHLRFLMINARVQSQCFHFLSQKKFYKDCLDGANQVKLINEIVKIATVVV